MEALIREDEDGLAVLMGDSTIQLSRDRTHRSGGVQEVIRYDDFLE